MVQGLDADVAGAHARAKTTFSRSWRRRHGDFSTHRRRQCARTIAAPCIHCRTAVEGLQVGIGRRWLGGCRQIDALFRGGLRRIFDFGLYWLARAVVSRSAKQDGRYTPIHWLLLSLAAWRGAWELIWKPFRWRKTEHGLDDESRHERTTRSLLQLERLVSGLIRRGELSQIRN